MLITSNPDALGRRCAREQKQKKVKSKVTIFAKKKSFAENVFGIAKSNIKIGYLKSGNSSVRAE